MTALQRNHARLHQLEHDLADTRRAGNQLAETLRAGLRLLAPLEQVAPDGLGAMLAQLARADLVHWELVSGDQVPAGVDGAG